MASASDPVGTGEAVAEQPPLRTTFVRSHSRFVLSWPNDRTLEIKYHRGVRVVAWILCILGWPILLVGLLGLIGQLMKPVPAGFVAAGLLLLWGGVLGLMGVWLFGPRHRFDASDGWWTVRHFWRTHRRPLARIRAVQLIGAGWFGSKFPGGLDIDGPVKFRSYQLNLVLEDVDEPRVFVTYNSDFTDMARKANLLSEFLDVPLLAAPRVHTLLKTYSVPDAQGPPDVAGVRRFRGSDALRPVTEGDLPEPFRSWIDGAQPLPAQVRLFPRTVAVVYDLVMFVTIGFTFVAMVFLIVIMFGPVLAGGDAWAPIVIVAGLCFLLALIPWYLLRRLVKTIGAWRQLRRGTLRQGILVGSEGVLVRMEPKCCYAIALDRFVNAKIETSVSQGRLPSEFVIETLDGRVAFFLDWSSATPEHLNQRVVELRSGSS